MFGFHQFPAASYIALKRFGSRTFQAAEEVGMHLAKFGIISVNGTVAKMAAAHDFSTYSQTYAHLKAAHCLGREASARDLGDASIRQEKCPPE